jgi:hypothetical protein
MGLDEGARGTRPPNEGKVINPTTFHERSHDLPARPGKDVDDTRREVLCVQGQRREVRRSTISWNTKDDHVACHQRWNKGRVALAVSVLSTFELRRLDFSLLQRVVERPDTSDQHMVHRVHRRYTQKQGRHRWVDGGSELRRQS